MVLISPPEKPEIDKEKINEGGRRTMGLEEELKTFLCKWS